MADHVHVPCLRLCCMYCRQGQTCVEADVGTPVSGCRRATQVPGLVGIGDTPHTLALPAPLHRSAQNVNTQCECLFSDGRNIYQNIHCQRIIKVALKSFYSNVYQYTKNIPNTETISKTIVAISFQTSTKNVPLSVRLLDPIL